MVVEAIGTIQEDGRGAARPYLFRRNLTVEMRCRVFAALQIPAKKGRDALLRVRWPDDILKKEHRIAAIMVEIKSMLEQKP